MTRTLCIGHLPPKCRDAAGRAIVARFGGWSRSSVEGAWADATGEMFIETMDRWECATDEPEAFAGMILSLGEAAGEQAVYVVVGGEPRILDTVHARKVEGVRD